MDFLPYILTLVMLCYILWEKRRQEKKVAARIESIRAEHAAEKEALRLAEAAHQENVRRINAEHQAYLVSLQGLHEKAIVAARSSTANTQRAVVRGQIYEQLVPFLPGFRWDPADAKFSGQPIDLIIYHGMSAFRDGGSTTPIEIIFADIKTGYARLTPVQKAIRAAVMEGRVKWVDIKAEQLLKEKS